MAITATITRPTIRDYLAMDSTALGALIRATRNLPGPDRLECGPMFVAQALRVARDAFPGAAAIVFDIDTDGVPLAVVVRDADGRQLHGEPDDYTEFTIAALLMEALAYQPDAMVEVPVPGFHRRMRRYLVEFPA